MPLVDTRWHLTRDEFDQAVHALLTRTVELTVAVLRRTGIPPEQVAGLFLIGGSARVPLASTLLHRAMRIEPTLIEVPDLVVAAGSLAAIPPAVTSPAPVSVPPALPPPLPLAPVSRPRRRLGSARAAVVLATALVMIVAVSLVVTQPWNARGATTPHATNSARASGTPGALPHFSGPPYEHLVATLTNSAGSVNAIAFSPDGTRIMAAGGDYDGRLWDVASGGQLAHYDVYPAGVSTVAFSPDGKTIATDGNDKTAVLWDVNTDKSRTVFTGHSDYINDVAFSPDGATLATTSLDDTVRLWDVATGALRFTLTGHTKYTRAVAFNRDGSVLASTSDDHTVRLWDPRTGKSIKVLTGHTSDVLAVAFSPDGSTLATAGNDHTIRLWR